MSEQIRILGVSINKSSNGLYSLTDLFKASGARSADRPKNWLVTNKAKEYVEFLANKSKGRKLPFDNNQQLTDNDSKGRKPPLEQNQVLTVVHGGDNNGTFVCKQLVYAYAMWVSVEFHHAVITAFDHLANDRVLEAQTVANVAISQIIKKREPNGVQTLAVIIGCTVFESRYYYEVLVSKGLLTKKVNKNGQAKYYPVGNQSWFEGYKRTTMLFNESVLNDLPIQQEVF